MSTASGPSPHGPDPRTPDTRPRRQRDPGAYLNLPIWQRFLVALVVAIVLLTLMVVWVSGHNTDSPPGSQQHLSARSNQEAEILVKQDQAPRVAQLAARSANGAGLAALLRTRIAAQVTRGAVSGPLRSARCRTTGFDSGPRHGFSCSVESGSVFYPYLGVVDTATGRATYCKRDPPPMPSDYVPVSPRCRG